MAQGKIASYVANGTIIPARCVKMDTTTDSKVLQSGAGDKTVGISQAGSRNPPGTALDDGNAALVGENVMVFEVGSECWAECGATVTTNDEVKSDSVGRVITASSTDEAIGRALQSGTVGVLIRVLVGSRKA